MAGASVLGCVFMSWSSFGAAVSLGAPPSPETSKLFEVDTASYV